MVDPDCWGSHGALYMAMLDFLGEIVMMGDRGGKGCGIFNFCLVYFVFCFVITIAIQPLTEN